MRMNGISKSITRNLANKTNEKEAAKAFSKQARNFDDYDAGNTIIQYKRKRVREHVLRYLLPYSSILELNAGTGQDAIYFAEQGFRVHATDIAEGMQGRLREKVEARGLCKRVTTELCSFTSLATLQQRGPYDLIFSNFAGLNCTGELKKVLRSFDPLLKPGGQVTLVILPGFSLWETLLVFKGKFRTAFRRMFSSKGVTSHVEGHYFKCWYYPPSFVTRNLGASFELLSVEGLCTIVPPSYIEHFAERHPSMYRFLQNLEDRWKGSWPWKGIGDYYIISLRKKG
jgi:ubiquinone/menaquinone biosynthesis C-methylase UbiE